MKKLLLTLLLISTTAIHAQKLNYDWKKMDPKERKEVINNLSPEDRKKLLTQFKNNMILDNLDLNEKDKSEFTTLYNEYVENQNKIKTQFDPTSNFDNLTDAEAKAKLQQSFDVGQQLLNNRRKYADKMQEIISPQKVLKLFQAEGKMREKMNERKPNPNFKGATRQR